VSVRDGVLIPVTTPTPLLRVVEESLSRCDEMRIVIPPGQTLAKVSVSVSMTRDEAEELRDALGTVLEAGRSSWRVGASWADQETDVAVRLTLRREDG
jgi:hypothetical protein